MNSRTLRLTAGLGGLLATAGFGFGIIHGAFAQSDQQSRVRGEVGSEAMATPVVPMAQVVAQLKAEGYAEVYEIEHERGKYEVKARHKDGRMVELYLDARTGKTLETEAEDDH